MCSSDFGLCDFFFTKEALCSKDDEDSLRNVVFASNDLSAQTAPVVKQESPDMDFKFVNDLGADELWPTFLENDINLDDLLDKSEEYIEDAAMDSAASDSGISTDAGVDQLLSELGSPDVLRHRFQESPSDRDFASPDTMESESDAASSISESGSSPAGGGIPPYQFELISGQTDSNEKPTFEESPSAAPQPTFIKISSNESTATAGNPPLKLEFVSNSPTMGVKRSPQVTKVRLDLSRGISTSKLGSQVLSSSSSSAPTATTSAPGGLSAGAKTIVVTHPGGKAAATSSLLKSGGTLFKTATINGKSILLPLNVKDINQGKIIKIINTGSSSSSVTNKSNVRTLTSLQSGGAGGGGLRTLFTTTKTADGRALLRMTPTALVAPNTVSSSTSPSSSPTSITIKEECTSEDECHQNGQELVLNEEERRLLKKEAILLPSHYPLTKQEERDLKRIRRKIRNKISAQDSRKRKKEYVDGLEDRVKSSTEENHQLQKRIRHLESQNESLVVQLKKFHNILGPGIHTRNQGHASTALMMLILSAALFVVPSLRPQQGGGDGEVSRSSEIPSAGRSRTLLEAKVSLGMNPIDPPGDDDESNDPDADPLSDHDYAPMSKKRKLTPPVYYPDLIRYMPPRLDKTLPDGSGEPPDGIGGGLKDISALFGSFLNGLSNNWTDPGGQGGHRTFGTAEKAHNRSLVVNLNTKGKLRDDIELE